MAKYGKYSKPFQLIILLLAAATFAGCNSCGKNKAVVADKQALEAAEKMDFRVKVRRFDQELFLVDSMNPAASFEKLAKNYPVFWPVYVENVIEAGKPGDQQTIKNLADFVSNPYIREMHRECEKYYHDFTPYAAQLDAAFKLYKYYFPEAVIPELVTMVSAFNYAHPVMDSVMGIGLDFYLGENYAPYKASNINFPEYIVRRMRKEYLVTNTMRYFFLSEYGPVPGSQKFIDHIIQEGKVLYALDAVLPDVPDTIKMGYTAEQLQWCFDNEVQMWAHYVQKKMLYSTDMMLYQRYINEAPFTSAPDVPQESAPRIGIWTGWQIVRKFMKENPKVTLQELMAESDFQKILTKSKYKPR